MDTRLGVLPNEIKFLISKFLDKKSLINFYYLGEPFSTYARAQLVSITSLSIPIKYFLDNEQRFNSASFETIISICPKLKEIKILGDGIWHSTHDLNDYFYYIHSSVTHIEISNIRIDFLLIESIKVFINLESLIIVNDRHSYILFEREFIELIRRLPKLQFLKLYNNNLFCVFDCNDISDIRSCYLDGEDINYHSYVLHFFKNELM